MGDKEPFLTLRSEYANNSRFTHKVDTGSEQYGHMRRVRGDGNCFCESDTRVLTNHGFLFLDEIEEQQRAGVELLFGCYDKQERQLLYRTGELVLPKQPPPYLVEFTEPNESGRWAEGSGLYGNEQTQKSKSSSHVSLRVTPDHDMFVQTGRMQRDGSTVWDKTRGAEDPHRKVSAESLLAGTGPDRIRLLACAENGYEPHDTTQRDAALADLRLSDAQSSAFIELLGFWLGNGSMQYQRNGRCNSVELRQAKKPDLAWLVEMLAKAGLSEADYVHCKYKNEVEQLFIMQQDWCSFFHAEFGKQYGDEAEHEEDDVEDGDDDEKQQPPADVQPSSDVQPAPCKRSKSIKYLPNWVRQLSAAEMRLLIAGLHRADGSFEDGREKAIFTPEPAFRDQLMQALLHCGYSASVSLLYRTGSICGYVFHDQSNNHKTHSVEFFNGLSAMEQLEYRPIKATADKWKVSWTSMATTAGQKSCTPVLSRGQAITRAAYDAERDGRTWCVNVDHEDHLIIAQRAQRDNSSGGVTKQSRPIVIANCFYRSYLYSVLEWAILPSHGVSAAQHHGKVEAFVRQFKQSAADILKEGRYDPVIVDDFYDTTLDLVTHCTQRTLDTAGAVHPASSAELPHRLALLAALHSKMNDVHIAQWYVTWMRCLTSAQLQRHAEQYSPYLVDQPNIAAFCQSEVDGIDKDADALQILALTTEMGVPVHISYLDATDGPLRGYVIPEGMERVVSLLYRPGHYDILYERDDKDAAIAGSSEANERKEPA